MKKLLTITLFSLSFTAFATNPNVTHEFNDNSEIASNVV